MIVNISRTRKIPMTPERKREIKRLIDSGVWHDCRHSMLVEAMDHIDALEKQIAQKQTSETSYVWPGW